MTPFSGVFAKNIKELFGFFSKCFQAIIKFVSFLLLKMPCKFLKRCDHVNYFLATFLKLSVLPHVHVGTGIGDL